MPKNFYTPAFETLWHKYPRHDAKFYSAKCFDKLSPADRYRLMSVMAKVQEKYRYTEKRSIPMLSTFINQRRWEDFLGNGNRQDDSGDVDEFLKSVQKAHPRQKRD